MSLISRVEIHNYLTEGLDQNRQFVDWNPSLTGITLRMDGLSSLINITNGGGKTSMAELWLYLLSRDRTLLANIRDKTAPKGRGYTHARIEFRTNDENSYREPELLEIDVDNIAGQTYVVGVALNNDVADAPIFYGYSGTLEDSPCYTKTEERISTVPDGEFIKRTRAMPQSKWDKFSNVREWQDYVGLFISMDVVRRNAAYQAKGSDDKNASFFGFKPRNGESYDSAFFKAVIAPDLLTNLLNSFSEENENSIEDTLHISLSRIVNAEREIARKQSYLETRESAIQKDLKPVVDTGTKASTLHEAMETALRGVKKDVALLNHFGSQNSLYKVSGIPNNVSSLPKHEGQDLRIREAIRSMVISRDEGILILDKKFSEMTGVAVGRIAEIADRKRIQNIVLNSQVIDFSCDFGFSTSGTAGGGHYRKGYSRQAVEQILPLLEDSRGATLDGLQDVFKSAFNISQSQIETNPASLKILNLDNTFSANEEKIKKLTKEVEDLSILIEGMERQIKGREENEAAWKIFSSFAVHLPEEVRALPRQARDWLADRCKSIQIELADMNRRNGALEKAWSEYQNAVDAAGLEGIAGLRDKHEQLSNKSKKLDTQLKAAFKKLDELTTLTPKLERDVGIANSKLIELNNTLTQMNKLKEGHIVFQGYFGDVDPIAIEAPSQTLINTTTRKNSVDDMLRSTNEDWEMLCSLSAQASRFKEIFGAENDPLQCDPVREHRLWQGKSHDAQQGMLPLEPLVAALESFELRFPKSTPSNWIEATDKRRVDLENSNRDVLSKKKAMECEIDALDCLSLVDDASFAQAWALLGQSPERLYSLLQATPLPLQNRVAALSSLSGLLSAPVFDSLAEMDAASILLEKHNITVPLLLKEPLLQAIQSQGEMHGELNLMGFFAGRYSRKVRILLEPEYAQNERALLVLQIEELTQRLDQIAIELPHVDFRNADYLLAQDAAKAIKLGSVVKFNQYDQEFKEAEVELKRLTPQIKDEALACLIASRDFLKKGGVEKQVVLWNECESLREQVAILKVELDSAVQRASPESIKAYLEARDYVNAGAEVGHEIIKNHNADAIESLEITKFELASHCSQINSHKFEFDEINTEKQIFNEEAGPDTIKKLQSILAFSSQVEDIAFMTQFARQSSAMNIESELFTSFQSKVNFESAAAYVDNLGKSETELVNEISRKKKMHSEIISGIQVLSKLNDVIKDFEIPNWKILRKAIHDFAYEVGSLASKTKKAHLELHALEEGLSPAEAHPLYKDIEALRTRVISATFEETSALSTLLADETFKLKELNPQETMEAFFKFQGEYNAAFADYKIKNKLFCEMSRQNVATKMAAFNGLEIDEIERSTPENIANLVNLFERLNLILIKDREDASRASQTAQNANEEALTQLSRLMEVAEDNLDALKKVMSRYENGCFKIKVQIAGEGLIKEILSDLKDKIKLDSTDSESATRTMRRTDENTIKKLLRITLIDKVFLEPTVTFIHGGIRNKESLVTNKLSTGQKVALEFMWIVRQAEYEIERGLRELSSKQAQRMRVKTNRVIFVDGIFSTLSDREIIRDAFSGLSDLGGNFQIIGFLHSPTWTNDYSVFPVYHVGKKLSNSSGTHLVAFTEKGRDKGTLGFFSSIGQVHETTV